MNPANEMLLVFGIAMLVPVFFWIGIMLQMGWRPWRRENLNPDMPYGKCEAVVAHDRFIGIPVVCGTKTNIKTSGYWHCSQHPIPVGTKAKTEATV